MLIPTFLFTASFSIPMVIVFKDTISLIMCKTATLNMV